MKKIIALILATMLVLTAVSAMATDSKGNPDINGGTTTEEKIQLVSIKATEKLQAIIDKITEAFKNDGDALKGLPEEVVSKIPADMKTINEMSCWQLVGDVSGLNGLVLIFKFETPYPENEEVTLLIGIDPADADVEWIVKTGKANADGDVVVSVTAEELSKIANNPFVAIPVSK